MEFANGFQEDDTPTFAPRPPVAAAATNSQTQRSSSNSTSRPTSCSTLDLTDDTPPDTPGLNGSSSSKGNASKSGNDGKSIIGNGSVNRQAQTGANGFGGYAAASSKGFTGANGSGKASPQAMRSSASPLQQPSNSTSPNAFAKYAATPNAQPQRTSPSSLSNSNGIRQSSHPLASTSSASSSSAAVAALGRVPVISSASTARTPSAYIPYAPSSLNGTNSAASGSKNYYREQAAGQVSIPIKNLASSTSSQAGSTSTNAGAMNGGAVKGKSREVMDLTTESNSDDDVIIQEPPPVCIGQLETFALIMNQAEEILPPRPVGEKAPNGKAWEFEELAEAQAAYKTAKIKYNLPLPVHIRRGEKLTDPHGRQREMLRVFTPGKIEMFGFVDQNVGTLLGPLLGDGWSGTGVTKDGKGILYCEAEVVREGQLQVRSLFPLLQRARSRN